MLETLLSSNASPSSKRKAANDSESLTFPPNYESTARHTHGSEKSIEPGLDLDHKTGTAEQEFLMERPPSKRARQEQFSSISAAGPVSTFQEEVNAAAKEVPRPKNPSSFLLMMPLDVLFEIVSHIAPTDLIILCRVCKTIRETLLSKSAVVVWRASRAKFDAPDCPEWISEPAWTALLFGDSCQACGTNNVTQVDFTLLRRICVKCRQQHLVLSTKVKNRYSGLNEYVLDLILSTQGRISKGIYYWDTDIEETMAKIDAAKEREPSGFPSMDDLLETLRMAKSAKARSIEERKSDWTHWHGQYQTGRSRDIARLQQRRLEQIKARLLGLGYDQRDLGFLIYHPEESKSTAMLTDESWDSIRLQLESETVEHRDRRLANEAGQQRQERAAVVYNRFIEHKKRIHPSRWKSLMTSLQITLLDPFLTIIGSNSSLDDTEAAVDEAFGDIEKILRDAENRQKLSLRALLPPAQGTIQNLEPLHLATAVFSCNNASKKRDTCTFSMTTHNSFYFGFNEVSEHYCDVVDWRWYWRNNNPHGSEYEDERRQRINGPGFTYNPRMAEAVQKVLNIIKLEPSTTTIEELDRKVDAERSPIRFGCQSCPTYRIKETWFSSIQRDGFGWRALVEHLSSDIAHNPSIDIFILTSKQAAEVRECELSQERNTWGCSKWACAHCSEHVEQLQRRDKVLLHLRDKHSIKEPQQTKDFLVIEPSKPSSAHRLRYNVDGEHLL
ncbi:hypothetical protein CPB83DRAFT_862393 [Crepidotus variabilis]|uniref:F-box domain-containing protein n=1 Tax=Crepidotus variabilis TaxID=179855 RepID=A0A9P6E6V6_9AGAR|nr:hypothetical protein CPB83DRAFT_862393 [Crepidotus variabilis]